jgi:hypothetical protein
MRAADEQIIVALLEEVLTPDRLVTLAQMAVARARAAQAAPDDERARLQERLREAQTALGRLTTAIATGGDIPALSDALKAQDAVRRDVEARLTALSKPAPTFDSAAEEALRAHVNEWRAILARQVPHARQIVTKLIKGKIVVTPETSGEQPGVRFEATGTIEKLIAGTFSGVFSRLLCLPRHR